MGERVNILITGASSGLGARMAHEFAARGRNLALCARRIDRLEQLRGELLRAHRNVDVAVAELDVTNHDDVFGAFHHLSGELGGLDRVIVNAGISQGAPVGTGHFNTNLAIANTNFIAALAQCEAAMEIFGARGDGHLVVISSIAALRGMPGFQIYSASKAGLATLAEAIRAHTLATPITVTTIYPGFIDSDLGGAGGSGTSKPFTVCTEKGVRAMVKAIEREPAQAKVPAWPWVPLGFALRHLPLRVIAAALTTTPSRGYSA
ncbi:SDR family oxidoreductase [Mycobacterium simiae]|uniref:Short chain dehydrogenase n=1 Tax=Mycobacterium simiae TaxID=1784 RepID=A0A1X0XI92_MYCSI|nr:SDR family oxidoreductase [Mycobacterium simiae]ORJ52567.1 short chain dehydrogenase [Mycobacterium simiae]